MGSLKNYNLNANEGFVIFLTSKFIYMLYWRFHFQSEIPNHVLIYSMEVNKYIGFWTLKMKCTQYGFYEQATFKNARAVFLIPKVKQRG
jgi:hypothetical protein